MPTIKLKTPAKINLILSILKKRLDNYHEVETIYQTISLFDVITVEYRESSELNIRIKSNSNEMPLDSSNLAYKAAHRFLEAIHQKADVKINITKNIPIAAGLAGGSSDAACVLNALNKINFYPLKEDIIKRIAQSLGADISFFLKSGSAIGKGIGDILQPIKTPNLDIVLVKPKNVAISSKWAYEKYDELSIKPAPKRIFDLLEGIEENNIEKLSENLFNSLEYVVFKEHHQLKVYKERLINLGCYNALLSGSGSAIFAIAKNEEHAREVEDKIKSEALDTWVVKTISVSSSIS
ncbi:MAG: 4-(cytidine 5'-diphospho)-2-C-methyl-D-erythritol kinase [Cyanobacteriota bacterium]